MTATTKSNYIGTINAPTSAAPQMISVRNLINICDPFVVNDLPACVRFTVTKDYDGAISVSHGSWYALLTEDDTNATTYIQLLTTLILSESRSVNTERSDTADIRIYPDSSELCGDIRAEVYAQGARRTLRSLSDVRTILATLKRPSVDDLRYDVLSDCLWWPAVTEDERGDRIDLTHDDTGMRVLVYPATDEFGDREGWDISWWTLDESYESVNHHKWVCYTGEVVDFLDEMMSDDGRRDEDPV